MVQIWTVTKQAQNKFAAAHTKMERSMLNNHIHLAQGEDKSVTYKICNVSKMKWSCARKFFSTVVQRPFSTI